MKIWVNTLVRNEERYVWYAVMSVIDYVDKVLIWDTGSSDKTIEIIREIKRLKKSKVDFKKVVQKDISHYTQLRQQMLEETRADWVVLVDGDEVWWDESIKKLVGVIKKSGRTLDSIVSKYVNVVGDIFHYQEEKAGRYEIDGVTGHLTIRAMNKKIRGLHFEKPHGQQGIFDENGKLIQERSASKRFLVNQSAFLHFTHMQRSGHDEIVPKRKMKLKYEIGKEFACDFYFPEVFFKPKPEIVDSVWETMSGEYFRRSIVQTPLKMLQRRILKPSKTGY